MAWNLEMKKKGRPIPMTFFQAVTALIFKRNKIVPTHLFPFFTNPIPLSTVFILPYLSWTLRKIRSVTHFPERFTVVIYCFSYMWNKECITPLRAHTLCLLQGFKGTEMWQLTITKWLWASWHLRRPLPPRSPAGGENTSGPHSGSCK